MALVFHCPHPSLTSVNLEICNKLNSTKLSSLYRRGSEINMTTFEDDLQLKQEESDEFEDLSKKFICTLCGFKFSEERFLTNHFNLCKNIENPSDRLGPGPINLQCKSSKEQVRSEELFDQQSTSEATFDIKIKLELDFTETISNPSSPLSGQPTQLEECANVHESLEKPDKSNKCDFIPAKYRSIKTYKRRHTEKDLGKKTAEKKFNCGICDYASARRDNFQRHMLKHKGQKPFKCEICGLASTHRYSIQRHMLTHTVDKKFNCEICDYASTLYSHFQRHMLKHTREKTLNCEISDYASTRPILKQTGQKPFKCEICGFGSTRRYIIQRHMLTHTVETKFNCKICNYAGTRRDNFLWHMLKHTGEKTFNCETCDYVGTGYDDFKQHMLEHKVEKTFICGVCDHASTGRDDFQQHMLEHTGENTFICGVCDHASTGRDDFQQHMLEHTEVESRQGIPGLFCDNNLINTYLQ